MFFCFFVWFILAYAPIRGGMSSNSYPWPLPPPTEMYFSASAVTILRAGLKQREHYRHVVRVVVIVLRVVVIVLRSPIGSNPLKAFGQHSPPPARRLHPLLLSVAVIQFS